MTGPVYYHSCSIDKQLGLMWPLTSLVLHNKNNMIVVVHIVIVQCMYIIMWSYTLVLLKLTAFKFSDFQKRAFSYNLI